MTTSKRSPGKPWSEEEVDQLKELISQGTPTRDIALKLSRTEHSIRSKAKNENISLRHANRPAFNQRPTDVTVPADIPYPTQ